MVSATNDAQKPEFAGEFGLLVLSFALGFLSGLLAALTISKGWEWFVVDTFEIEGLSIIQAWGISWLVHTLTFVSRPSDPEHELSVADVVANTITSMLYSLIALLSLFILVQFR